MVWLKTLDGWIAHTNKLGDKSAVGDDLFVTNIRGLRSHREHVANSILIKLNQIGTVTETIDAIVLAGKPAIHRHLAPFRRDRDVTMLISRSNRCRTESKRAALAHRKSGKIQPIIAHRGGVGRQAIYPRNNRLMHSLFTDFSTIFLTRYSSPIQYNAG